MNIKKFVRPTTGQEGKFWRIVTNQARRVQQTKYIADLRPKQMQGKVWSFSDKDLGQSN